METGTFPRFFHDLRWKRPCWRGEEPIAHLHAVGRAFKHIYANLGKADSAIFDETLGGKPRKELRNESQFASVEANIKDDLIRNIGPIRRQSCIDAVKRENQTMQDGLTEIARKLDDRIRETKNRMDAIIRFKSQFRDYMLTTPRDGSNPAVDEVRMISNGHFNPAKYLRALHYCHDFEFNGGCFFGCEAPEAHHLAARRARKADEGRHQGDYHR